MLRSNNGKQNSYEFVSIEDLVQQDHTLRKIDKYISFEFILEKVKSPCSEDTGRPALDPF